MKKVILLLVALVAFLMCAGCQRGDFKVSPVIENMPAPHDGYNIGPELYVEQGDPVPVTGAVIWIRGLEPNDLKLKVDR